MLYLQSLPCSFAIARKDEGWFAVSYSSDDNQQIEYVPWVYKKLGNAKAAIRRLAERLAPRNWERYKIVIEDKSATITKLDERGRALGDYAFDRMRIRFKIEKISVPKGRLIPLNNPPVEDWTVARVKSWDTRNLTMEQWLERLNPLNFDGIGSERAEESARYAAKCDWWKFGDFSQVEARDWVFILRHRPDLIDRSPCVNEFSDEDWCLLLRRQPQFVDRFNRWNELPSYLRLFLLRRQPKFAENFTNWDEFSSWEWVMLLKAQSQLADRCPWEMLSGSDWKELLVARPEFEQYCDWTKLASGDWVGLLKVQPQFASRCPWEMLSGSDWKELLVVRPEFEQHCDWTKLASGDWVGLLEVQPQFASRCPWEMLSGSDWMELLVVRPEFEQYCVWTKLEGLDINDWYQVLNSQPCLARHFTKWNQFSNEQKLRLLKKSADFCPLVDFEKLPLSVRINFLLVRPEFSERMNWKDVDNDIDWYRLMAVMPDRVEDVPDNIKQPERQSYVWLGRSGPIVVVPITGRISRDQLPFWVSKESLGMGLDPMPYYEAIQAVSCILNRNVKEKVIAIDGAYVGDERTYSSRNFTEILKEWFRSNDTSIKIVFLEYGEYYSDEALND